MNGNFERDKSAYPYGAIYVGSDWTLHYVPTLEQLSKVPLPRKVAERAALDMNITYWGADKSPHTAKADIPAVIRRAALTALEEREITGPQYDQIIGKLAEV